MKNVRLILVGESGGGGGMGGGGGYGSMIAGIVQGVTGIGQMIGGAVKSGKAKKLMPEETDPTQVAQIDELRRLRMGYQTGSEASMYRNTINNGLVNAVEGASRMSGGNTGSLLAAISGSQVNAMNAYNEVAAGLEKNRMGALALENEAVDKVAQRRLDIKMAKYLQAEADATSLKKAGAQNFGASFNTFSGKGSNVETDKTDSTGSIARLISTPQVSNTTMSTGDYTKEGDGTYTEQAPQQGGQEIELKRSKGNYSWAA